MVNKNVIFWRFILCPFLTVCIFVKLSIRMQHNSEAVEYGPNLIVEIKGKLLSTFRGN